MFIAMLYKYNRTQHIVVKLWLCIYAKIDSLSVECQFMALHASPSA